MSIRTILAPFIDDADAPAVRLALAAARDLQAHAVGLQIEAAEQYIPPPPRTPALAGMGAGAFGMSGVRTELATTPDPVAQQTRSRDEAAGAAKALFAALCQEHDVAFLDDEAREGRGDHPLPSASYQRETGSLPSIVARHAPAYDVLVTESAAVAKAARPARGAIDSALMQAGRPVLLAPAKPPEHLNGRVLVAWNDSPQCWHALSTALPFLARAQQVVLFHAGKDRAERLAEERAADYLAWHGIEAEVVQHEPGSVGIADYLLSQCGERQVGLMVMGAYSHSPLREKLLGGVTLSVLSNVAATPVLMMH